MSFSINLPLFEGPFDLLLFFIQRDELDIYDIPIATITNDFLAYLQTLEQMNLEVASEFILVAATLMRIKAKMLLPRPVIDEQGKEIDPREELVRNLLEYKKYKSVLEELTFLQNERLLKEARGNVNEEIKNLAVKSDQEAEMESLDLYKILQVYLKVMKRFEFAQQRPKHTIIMYPYTIDEQKNYILEQIQAQNYLSFIEILEEYPSKMLVIFRFLAILELLQLGLISLQIGIGFNNFWIRKV